MSAGGNGFGLVSPFEGSVDLPPIATSCQPLGSIKGAIVEVGSISGSATGSGALHVVVASGDSSLLLSREQRRMEVVGHPEMLGERLQEFGNVRPQPDVWAAGLPI
jgi:hypothetical protein